MATWLERARAKIPQTQSQRAVVTVDRSSIGSNDCNDGSLTEAFPEIRAATGTPKLCKNPGQGTPVTVIRNLVTVPQSAVPRNNLPNPVASNDCNEGTLSGQIPEIAVAAGQSRQTKQPPPNGDDWARAQIREWRKAIAVVQSNIPDIVKLKEVSLRFLDNPEAEIAIANGWDAVSLFGMNEGDAPKERIDCWGLVQFMAWGIHSGAITALNQKVCAIRTRSGAVLQQPRVRANFDQAVPWWRHPGITNTIDGNPDE